MGWEFELKVAGADEARANLSSGTWETRGPEGSGSPLAALPSTTHLNGDRLPCPDEGSSADERHAQTEAAGAMAIVAVHEIGNVVGWLDMALAMLERGTCGADGTWTEAPVDARATIRDARMGVRHISDIVHALRRLGRSCAAESEPFDPVEALRVAIHFAERRISARASLVERVGPTPMLRGRKYELTCVFLNLLLNALEALPAETPETNTITVVAKTVDSMAYFEVCDTGVGIPPEVAEHIFEPYFTGRMDSGGMGIGLHVCRRIVSEMGGTIAFESALGRGTRFRVTVPGCV
jgi:two-component system, NtrC family, sensor kinase